MRCLRRALRRFTGRPVLADAERRRLEEWARLRFRLGSSDPVGDVIAASARLMEAGLDRNEAIETVLRIVREVHAELSDRP